MVIFENLFDTVSVYLAIPFLWLLTIIIEVQKTVYYPSKVLHNHLYKCKYTLETTESELSKVAFRSLGSLT